MDNELILDIEGGNNRFLTYYHYLCSLHRLIEARSTPDVIISTVTHSSSYAKIQRRKEFDSSKVAEFLRNSWFTEEQINISVSNNNSFSNHWTPIQLYYCSYLQIRALNMVKNPDSKDDHRGAMKFIANYIGSNSDVFPFPWNVLCVGDCKNPEYKNMKDIVTEISTLTKPWNSDLPSSLAKFLKTTRRRVHEKIIEERKNTNKIKRLSAVEKQKLLLGMGDTSLFDCFYRLRIRSNYEDADSFIASISMTSETNEMGSAIKTIAFRTMLMLELLILRHIGKNVYEKIIEDYKKSINKSLAYERWERIKST